VFSYRSAPKFQTGTSNIWRHSSDPDLYGEHNLTGMLNIAAFKGVMGVHVSPGFELEVVIPTTHTDRQTDRQTGLSGISKRNFP